MKTAAQTIVPYDPSWITQFDSIKHRVFPVLEQLITGIEHVGSTSVVGLAAKPVIDIDVIYRDNTLLGEIIRRLEVLGYVHEGDRGIPDREAFIAPPGIRHHLYVCKENSLALRNHLAVRDFLRTHEAERIAYGNLKFALANLYDSSPTAYVEAKTQFLVEILKKCGITKEELNSIETVNRTNK